MSSFIQLNNVTLDIPVFDISRSFRKSLFNHYIGGNIQQDQNESNKSSNNNICVRALENINFRLEKGDRLGLLGHNGAGKTTLLRVLAGVYKPTSGSIQSKGRITPLFNMMLGLDLDDSGYDNISIIGKYLGMTSNELKAKRDDIISFSCLGDFIHFPVRTYSTGMLMRLSFAVATAMDPEIMVMDEDIGAGDAHFAEAAKERLRQFYSRLDTLVIASHSDDLIRSLCTKALLLEHGKVKAYGAVEDVLREYHKKNENADKQETTEKNEKIEKNEITEKTKKTEKTETETV